MAKSILFHDHLDYHPLFEHAKELDADVRFSTEASSAEEAMGGKVPDIYVMGWTNSGYVMDIGPMVRDAQELRRVHPGIVIIARQYGAHHEYFKDTCNELVSRTDDPNPLLDAIRKYL